MATTASTIAAPLPMGTDRWNRYNITVLAICICAWAFDVYEMTVMQIVTPLLVKEFGMSLATMGTITTVSRWIGLIGTFVFPALADVYGRKPILIFSILGFSLFSGLTGFSGGVITLLVFSSITRIALSGQTPVGMVMVAETAPTKWRATALGGLVGGYPFGYFLCSLAALVVVPLWGWRPLYWLGVLPALMVFWVAWGIKESPRFEHVTAAMVKEGIRKQFNILTPIRQYPREMVIGTLVYFFYLFTWIGWSAWMPQYLAVEKHLGFKAMASDLSVWMAVAILAYWICGWLCDHFGRRFVIPLFVTPAAILLVVLGHVSSPSSLFWLGLAANFLITGSFGTGLGYTTELFPTQIRGTAVGAAFFLGTVGASTAPMIMGIIASKASIAAGLPVLALSFFLIAPLFLFFAKETTRKELGDFVGEKGVRG